VGRQQFHWGVPARGRLAVALTSALVAAVVGLAASPASAAASLTLTPSQGTAGSTYTISGSGFGSSEHIKFTWDDPSGLQIATTTASFSGSFSNVQAYAPNGSATGDHLVYATGTGTLPSQASTTYKVTAPPGGGTTTTTHATTTTTRPPSTTTTTGSVGGGIVTTPTTTKNSNSTPTTRGTNPTPVIPDGSVTVTTTVGPLDVQSQTDVLGESLNDSTTTTTLLDDGEQALAPFPTVKTGGGCSACWGAVAVLLGGVATVALTQQKKTKLRRRAKARRWR